jgi:hypothetical protein
MCTSTMHGRILSDIWTCPVEDTVNVDISEKERKGASSAEVA